MTRSDRFGVIFAAIGLCTFVFAQDAPMFRGNLRHTGVYNASGVATLNGIKWKFHTSGRVISSPAVANGVAYVGSTDGNLYALDVGLGALKWKFATQSWVTSSPAIESGAVYFESYDSNFYAVDGTGQLKWKFQASREFFQAYKGKSIGTAEFRSFWKQRFGNQKNALDVWLDSTGGLPDLERKEATGPRTTEILIATYL